MNLNSVNIIYLVSFLDLFAVGLTFPLFSTHLKDLGASHFTIGLFSSAYGGIQVLSGPIVGSWSDVRDRKSVLQITTLLCCFLYGTLGIPDSILIIFLIRCLLGVFKHTQTLTKAILTDFVPASHNIAVFGKSSAYANLGFIIGPLIGGYLSQFDHGFMYVCSITAVLFVFNLCIVSNLPNEQKTKDQHGSLLVGIKKEFSKTIKELKDIDWKVHWISFFLKFLTGLSMSTYFTNQALYLRERYELSQKDIGYTISFHGFIGMFVSFFINHIDKLYKHDASGFQQLGHFYALASACFLCIYFSPNVFMFMLCLIPLAISSTVLRVLGMNLLLKQCEPSKRGSLTGASNSVMSIARFVTPLLTGIVAQTMGENSVILLAVIPVVIGAVTAHYFSKRTKIL
ncbi:major facilitator superfamily domain-containing protein 9-like [Aethina tumida]|uniref:major facilitator superfamily domain-containing protein 9-like n=1 Tax=Aethina tumida TaxID=116153 RepID=UPI00214907BF|nr:major facilitator superfamily domain-containing protein 9-like [Aethina tumida]